jgi:hypothetical protein
MLGRCADDKCHALITPWTGQWAGLGFVEGIGACRDAWRCRIPGIGGRYVMYGPIMTLSMSRKMSLTHSALRMVLVHPSQRLQLPVRDRE